MKRIVTMVIALGVVVGACGGGDEDSVADDPAVEAESESEAAPADEDAPSEETSDEKSSDEESSDEESSDAEPSDEDVVDASDVDGDSDDAGDVGDPGDADSAQPISALSDIPERCRDLMGDFLREIEPVVSDIDWQTASLDEFQTIGDDFEARSAEFEEASEASGCNDLQFVGDSEFDLMVELADEEAPGTAGFFEFLGELGAAAGGSNGADAGAGAFETCDDAIAYMQDLVGTYDVITEAPATELLKFQSLPTVLTTCTPEQLEYFDSPEVADFLGESR